MHLFHPYLRSFGPTTGVIPPVLDPGTDLTESPAQIIAKYLVDEGVGSAIVAPQQPWPIYVSSMPAGLPNNAIVVYDTTPLPDGRLSSGQVIEHPGIQIRVRATDYAVAWTKINAAKHAVDSIIRAQVDLPLESYLVWSFRRTGGINYLGQEIDTRRVGFTINGTMTINQIA